MSFYLTYRPQVIEDIDNVAVREQLLSLLTKDTKELPHAYLFTGPRGAGKTTAARIIAKMFDCTKPTKHGPCGKCEQCTSVAAGKNLDVLELDAASNRGIDEIRAIRDAINLSPTSAAYKVYIIDEVHMLTTEAFNALLKTLEEPPAHAVFVLATTDPQKVPATIKSRCVGITFHRASTNELLSGLKRIVTAEKIKIDSDALTLIATGADGSFRDAVKTLELVSFHKNGIDEKLVRSLTSLTEAADITKFLTSIHEKNVKGAFVCIAKLVSDGADMKTFLTSCLTILEQDLVRVSEGAKGEVSVDRILVEIHLLTEAYGMMRISPIPQLPIELAVVELCGKGAQQETPSVGKTDAVARVPMSPVPPAPKEPKKDETEEPAVQSLGLLTLDKLTEHWLDFIAALKPYNHSVAGVMRSARPKSVEHGIVTIEAFYPFHKEKLSESKTKDILVMVLKRLFGEKVKVEIVLGKK